jgi:hypothetical protein
MKRNVIPLRAGLFARLAQKFWFYLRVGVVIVLLIGLAQLVSGRMGLSSPLGFLAGMIRLFPFAVAGAAGFAIADEIRGRRR